MSTLKITCAKLGGIYHEPVSSFGQAHFLNQFLSIYWNAMTNTSSLPDRLSVDPRSRFHNAELLASGIGIRINGVERSDVEEYCISEGWIKVAHGKARDRRGQPILLTLKGTIEAFLKA
jgi:hypothetical protein